MKALMLVKEGVLEGANSGIDIRTCRASLQALGITHHMAVAEVMPEDDYVNTHDFIVIPSHAAGFDSVIDDSGITIPIIGLGATAGAAGFGASTGVTSGATNREDEFYTASWTSSEYLAAFGYKYTLGTGTALMTVSANEPSGTGGGAQTDVGRVCMWSNATAGSSKLYVSSLETANHSMLPFLVQQAIDDGEITGPTPQKAPIVVDIDHINGQFSNDDPTVLDKIASYVPSGGVMWCGIQNSNAAYFANMGATLKATLLQYQDAPFKYCWHDHTLSPVIGANLDAAGYSTDHTKADQNTLYAADKAIWEGLGLSFNETNAYYNSGSNSWDEASLELFSSDVSKMSSPANDTSQAGYGFVAFRAIGAANISRPQEARTVLYTNYLHNKRKTRGIQMFPTYDMAFNDDMPYNAIADWRKNFNWYTNAVSMCQTLYFHDEDFIAADQSPGTSGKQHGYVAMQLLSDMGAYLKDVSKPFADPGDYVNKINYA